MKLVLDSNVIVAAFAGRGLCHELFEYSLLNHKIITSEFILNECTRVLEEKIRLPESTVKDIGTLLRQECEFVEPAGLSVENLDDPDDQPIVGTAVSGSAKCIVTGDNDLLSLEKVHSIPIYTPRTFWEQQR